MNPSWLVMAGGSSLSVSPPQRKVRVLAAVAGWAAGAGEAAGAGAGPAGAAGFGASVGLAGGGVGAQAASRPAAAVRPAARRKARRVSEANAMVGGPPRRCSVQCTTVNVTLNIGSGHLARNRRRAATGGRLG